MPRTPEMQKDEMKWKTAHHKTAIPVNRRSSKMPDCLNTPLSSSPPTAKHTCFLFFIFLANRESWKLGKLKPGHGTEWSFFAARICHIFERVMIAQSRRYQMTS
jgi:hypothetical protein